MRDYIGDGVDRAAQGVKDKLRIYPLSQAASPPKTKFISATGKLGYNAAPPNDFNYWEMLNQLVQEKPVGAHDPETRGLLAAMQDAAGYVAFGVCSSAMLD